MKNNKIVLTLDKTDIDGLQYFLNMVVEDCVQSLPDDMERVIELMNKINNAGINHEKQV